MTDTEAYLALNLIPRLGPVRLRRLLNALGSPQRVLSATTDELRQVEGVGPEAAKSIAGWKETVRLDDELAAIEKAGITILIQTDAKYPTLLREIHDPPTVLYVWGTLEERDKHSVGVVGTRKPSHYAQDSAKKLSYQLAYAGLTVISGLARGIDTAAHQGALAAKGRTIAVIGSGLNCLYPPENRELAEKIAESGAVISEFPMNTSADRQTFPMRNRIISGWSFGTLVVEAGLNSGAIITANQASEQGRTIYAIPGRIDQPGAIGSNRLIQQGAKLVMTAQDILDDLSMLFPKTPELTISTPRVELLGEEKRIYDALGNEERIVDELVAKSGLPSPVVSSTLLGLEMRRLVKALPGGRYVRLI